MLAASRHRSWSSRNRGIAGYGFEVAVVVVVDEINTENDDRNGAGNAPMRATVRSEPFA